MQLDKLTIQPVKTEKTYKLAEKGTYTFIVPIKLSKADIKRAIKAYFDVDAIDIKTVKKKGKQKYNRLSQRKYTQADRKKAYVKLAKDQTLDIFK